MQEILIPITELKKILPIKDTRTFAKNFTIVIVNNVQFIDEQDICDFFDVKDLTEPFITLKEASDFACIDIKAMHHKARTGEVPCYRLEKAIGSPMFFRKSQLAKMLELQLDFDYKILSEYVKFKPLLGLLREYTNCDIVKRFVSEREIDVFNAYYFRNKTLKKIGVEQNLTRERVRQILNSSRKKIKVRLSDITKVLSIKEDELIIKKLTQKNINLKHTIKKMREECVCGNVENIQKSVFSYSDKALKILDKKVSECDFSVRTLNFFKAAGIQTVDDIINFNKNDFMRYRNFGKKSLTEIEDFLIQHDLKFNK